MWCFTPGQEGARLCSRFYRGAALPWVTKPFASPPGKAWMQLRRCRARAQVELTRVSFLGVLLSWATQLDMWIQEQAKCSIFQPKVSWLSLSAGRQNVLNCLFFQSKLFNINADYPVAHFKESSSNFQSFGDLIFLWIYGQPPRSLCMVSFLRHLYFSRDHFKDIRL